MHCPPHRHCPRYDPFPLPRPQDQRFRERNGIPKDAVVYMCMHSTFKMQPQFDGVLAGILRRVPKAVVVVTEGRRETWTEQVRNGRWLCCVVCCLPPRA